jgi:hypothetical protein
MYNKLDGLFLCLRDSEALSANLGGKSRTPLNNAELRNGTNNSVALGPFEIWSDTTGFLQSFGSENMLPARSAIQLNHYAETESLPTEHLILVNCETQEFVSKTELTIIPTDSPGLMPIGAWKQRKRIPTDQNIPCFTAGTLIATRDGQKRIDDLRLGDHVITRDSDFIQVQAISQQSYSRAKKRLNTDFRPIVIPAGTFCNSRDLHLSPTHRLMVTDNQAELLFGSSEVFVAAKTALEYAWAHQQPADFDVTYFHILLTTHELVLVEAMCAESLFLSDMPERVFETGKIWETLDGFDMRKVTHNGTVLPILRRHETRSLMYRLPDRIDQVAAQQAPNEVFYAAA